MDKMSSRMEEMSSNVKRACSIAWWRDRIRNMDRHRMWISFWCCLSFIGLGVCLVVFAPTLLDIAHQLNVGIGLLSVVLLTRAIGGVLGTVGSGVLMDMFPRVQYTLFCCFLLSGIAANSLVPVAGHIGVLAVVMFAIGVALGGVDNGAHAILMRLWGEDSGPSMQFLHAAFALGAFIAPLIAKPFLTDITDNKDLNTSSIFNVSCTEEIDAVSLCNDLYSLQCYCIDSITEACNRTSSQAVEIYFDLVGNQTSCTVLEDETLSLKYGYAYWIAASLFVIPTIAFLYYSIWYDFLPRCLRNRESNPEDDREKETKSMEADNKEQNGREEEEEIEEIEDTEEEEENDDEYFEEGGAVALVKEEKSLRKSSESRTTLKTYKYPAFFILFWFMFSYVGSEVAYGSLLFTYTVKSELKFDKQTAATVTAVFWGLFTFMRVFSIALAIMKVRASVMMSLNLSGSIVAIFIFSIFPHNVIVVWICSALLGASFASIFPTTMAWMSEHLPVSGKASAVLNGGGNIGDIVLPSTIAALIGNVHPDAFVYSILALIVTSTTLLIVLFVMTAVYQRRHKQSPSAKNRDYHRLRTVGDQSSQNGDLRTDTEEESTVI